VLTILVNTLLTLNQRMKDLGQSLQGKTIAASHPVYQYMREAYGIAGPSYVWEPEKKLEASDLADLAAAQPVTFLLWEGDPSLENAAALDQAQTAAVVFDPGATAVGEWLALQQANVDRLAAAIATLVNTP
jgi:zinc transport system substrate-binding protein